MDVEGERGHNVDEVQGEGFADRVMENVNPCDGETSSLGNPVYGDKTWKTRVWVVTWVGGVESGVRRRGRVEEDPKERTPPPARRNDSSNPGRHQHAPSRPLH